MLLVGFVQELQQLNDIEAPLIDTPIEEIIADPEKYAIDYMEAVFEENDEKFNTSYGLGREFALNITGLATFNEQLSYPDGKPVDKKLPKSYSLGDTLDNPNEICHNCKFYADDYCIKWDAEIRDEYWCESWQE